MFWHVLRIGLAALILVACIFLAFLPGGYDPSAVILSSIAHAVGFAGILLIPIGLTWLVFGRSNRKIIRVAASTACSVVVTLAAALGAVAGGSIYLAIGLLVLGAYISFRFVRWNWRHESDIGTLDPIPLYFVIIPLLVLTARFAFIETAVDFSRNRAIENSREIIQAIEAYHARNGHYPVSLHSEWEDYDPGIVGIGRYYYEPNGDAYNLFFEQFSDELGTREFVMYNKLGKHQFSAHNRDILEFSPQDRARQQGWHRVVDLPHKNWKYFQFD